MTPAVLLIALASASAASAETTYICTDAKGRKAIQDRPCAAEAVAAEARETKSHPRPLWSAPDFAAQAKGINCNYYRAVEESARAQSNTIGSNYSRAAARDQMVAMQERQQKECR